MNYKNKRRIHYGQDKFFRFVLRDLIKRFYFQHSRLYIYDNSNEWECVEFFLDEKILILLPFWSLCEILIFTEIPLNLYFLQHFYPILYICVHK
jgi:hypothetical protein